MEPKGDKADRPARQQEAGEPRPVTDGPPKDQLDALAALYGRGRLDEVVRLAGALLERFPGALVLHNFLGAANAGMRRFDAAIASYHQALRIRPDYAEAHNNLGAALKERGDLDAAIASYRRAIEVRPDYAAAHSNLGNALKEKGELDAAIESHRRALAIRPDYAEAHSNLGNALQEKGELDAAIESHRRAIGIRPDYVAAFSNLGNALRQKGDLPGAVEAYSRALHLRPDFAEAHFNLGIAQKEQGNLAGAIQSYGRALQLRPHFAEAHNSLGMALKAQGDLSGAIDSYVSALEINPDFVAAHYNLGNALQERSDFEGAIECYNHVLEFRPDDAEVHYNLGSSYRAISRYDDALRHFRRADFKDSESFELECLYLLGEEKSFLEKNAQLYDKKKINAVLGALGSHAEIRYGTFVPNAFCASPLEYVYSSKVPENDAFFRDLIEEIYRLSNNTGGQSLLVNGFQTAGNLFSIRNDLIQRTEAIIRAKIDEYRRNFLDSQEPFITRFPESFIVDGWVLSMRSEGFVKSHIHEYSWISGTIYLRVPGDLKDDQGNITFSTHGGFYPAGSGKHPEKIVKVSQGVINLFPSSLFHQTIPFESEEERISLAFDIRPV